jgi:NitT/TauT family transport system substrate-binding protein
MVLVCTFLTMTSGWHAMAAEKLRLAVQKTGTFAWELAIIKARGLDREAGLDLEVKELASTEAGKIALSGGSADIILSDWLWVSRERSLGTRFVFYPYSTAVGAVMVPETSSIKSLADLSGKTLGVAGGPLDKSWLLLQVYAGRSGTDLKSKARIVYGAPPLLTEKAAQGELDGVLNFWNFCADLQTRGFRPLLTIEEVEKGLGAKAPIAMVGYVFSEDFAKSRQSAIDRFLKIARQAKEILAQSDEDWKTLGPRLGLKSVAALATYRKTYVAGLPQRPVEEEERDAAALYLLLAEAGGPQLVGASPVLVAGTYYRPAAP